MTNESPSELENPKKKLTTGKLILIFLLVFTVTFVSNLNIKEPIISQVKMALDSSRKCPINYSDVTFSWLLPKVTIKSPVLSSKCIGKSKGKPIKLRDIDISLALPSIVPFGAKVHTNIRLKKGSTQINLYPTFTFGGIKLKIEDTFIKDDIIKALFGKSLIKGSLSVESVLDIERNSISSGSILIKSKDINIPQQLISGISIPELKLTNFLLKTELLKRSLRVSSFVLGDDKSPIILNLNGTINVNKYNFSRSRLNLKGNIKFSPEIITKLPILNVLLSGKSSQDGFFKIEIGGTLEVPSPKIL